MSKTKKSAKQTVKNLLSSHHKWTKNTSFRDGKGEVILSLDECKDGSAPARFCLIGALTYCYGDYTPKFKAACKKLVKALPDDYKKFEDVVGFNDDEKTTFKDVKRVLNKANV